MFRSVPYLLTNPGSVTSENLRQNLKNALIQDDFSSHEVKRYRMKGHLIYFEISSFCLLEKLTSSGDLKMSEY